MPSRKQKEESTSQPPTPPRWKGADFFELVHHFNARAFGLLKASASAHGELWAGLDAEAMRRAARLPFVVVEVHFTDKQWWQSVVMNPQAAPVEPPSLWTAQVAERFMSEVLVFAWHAANRDALTARITLGMVPEVVQIIRGLTPDQLDVISGLRRDALTLRWQRDREFWTRLIEAAQDGDEETLADIHLHAKLRLSGELMACSTSAPQVGTGER